MYRITLQKQKLNFSSAHFITFENRCEALHGHNYYTYVDIKGELDNNAYILDFKFVKEELTSICDTLDHKFLLACDNPNLKITKTDSSYEILFKAKKYVLPKEDVLELPLTNTTVEKLSEHICNRLCESLEQQGKLSSVISVEVGVEETAGQMAGFIKHLRKP